MELFPNRQPLAIFSPDARYRWALGRGDKDGRLLHWVCLNPSTAGLWTEDPSTRRIMRFTWDLGYAGYTLHNLFAICATSPRAMKAIPDPVGEHNHQHIMAMVDRAMDRKEPIICAWGNHGSYLDQANTVLGWLDIVPAWQLWCLGKTAQGMPMHPLYVPAAAKFVRLDGKLHKYPIEGNFP